MGDTTASAFPFETLNATLITSTAITIHQISKTEKYPKNAVNTLLLPSGMKMSKPSAGRISAKLPNSVFDFRMIVVAIVPRT